MTNEFEPTTSTPRVSVVTCFHNRRDHVKVSVGSLLDQSYDDYEVVVVDDASTDGTWELLQDLQHPRLKLHRNDTNVGFVHSLLRAIDVAQGELIAVHGAGDLSYPRRLEQQVAFLDTNSDYVAVGCHRDVLSPDGMVVSRTTPGPGPITLESLLEGNTYSHGEVMYRRQAYEASGGYRAHMRFAQDYDLWLRLCQVGHLGVVQEVLYGRVAHEDGVSFNPVRVAQQAAFSELARAMAAGEIPDQAQAIEAAAKNGVHSVLPVTNARVVAKLRKRVHVLISLGRWDAAHSLAFEVMQPGWTNAAETTLVRLACNVGRLIDSQGNLTRRILARLRT